MRKFFVVFTLTLVLLPLDSHADGLARFLGTWTGSRTYSLPNLKGTETFTMKVSRFKKTGLQCEALVKRPGWNEVYQVEIFYPGGDIAGTGGKAGTSGEWIVYDFRSGRWKVMGKRLTWNSYIYWSNLGERTKQKTTWRIDSRGRLQELRTVGGGRITATAEKQR